MRVLDNGPIQPANIERFDDPDIETGLANTHRSADDAVYRLIELDIDELEDVRNLPFTWTPTYMLEKLRDDSESLPPVVVVQTDRGHGFGLIDGLNRTYAHWLTGRRTIRAYELLVRRHS